ncbi:hypothetical protein NC651_035494 [Populus alba x Populus x berolinensis]|nr:hypothetical protein NC651_035494 [Populus alba x Populus x berolinensis]
MGSLTPQLDFAQSPPGTTIEFRSIDQSDLIGPRVLLEGYILPALKKLSYLSFRVNRQ